MESPPTPAPVEADEEVGNIPSEPLPVDLDLNPDLEYEEEEKAEIGINARTPALTASALEGSAPVSKGSLIKEGESETTTTPSSAYSPPSVNVSLWTLPFDDAFELVKRLFAQGKKHEPITLEQQSRFINYIDKRLLQIQRKFIKNQSESIVTYSPEELIDDLSPIVDLLWFLLLDHESLFGQDEYYIKIVGDLDDWFVYYTFPTLSARKDADVRFHVKLFDFCQRLDTQISFLIDGYDANGHTSKMSATELVRLSPTIMRLRLTIIEKLEQSRSTLNTRREDAANNDLLNILDVEIGRIFEGVLERV